jgi:hypothetical protein
VPVTESRSRRPRRRPVRDWSLPRGCLRLGLVRTVHWQAPRPAAAARVPSESSAPSYWHPRSESSEPRPVGCPGQTSGHSADSPSPGPDLGPDLAGNRGRESGPGPDSRFAGAGSRGPAPIPNLKNRGTRSACRDLGARDFEQDSHWQRPRRRPAAAPAQVPATMRTLRTMTTTINSRHGTALLHRT